LTMSTTHAEETLAQLAERYERKNRSLTRDEKAEVAGLLAPTLRDFPADASRIFGRFSKSLPPDALSRGLAEAWSSLDDTLRGEIRDAIRKIPADDPMDARPYLVLDLVGVDVVAAQHMLTNMCHGIHKTRDHLPTAKTSRRLRGVFAPPGGAAQVRRLAEAGVKLDREWEAACMLAAVFTPSSKGARFPAPESQLEVLRWVAAGKPVKELPEPLCSNINGAILEWSGELRAALRNESNGWPGVLPGIVAKALCRPAETAEPEVTAPGTAAGEEEAGTGSQIAEAFDPVSALERVTIYVRELDRAAKASSAEVEQLREDLSDEREELARLRKNHALLSGEKRRLEATVATQQAAQDELSRERGKQQDKLQDLRSAQKRLHEEHRAEITKHENRMAALSTRISAEGEQELSIFRKRMAAALRLDYEQFKKVDGRPLEDKTSKLLLAQLKRVFRALESQGICFDGDA